jgi:hypothetical protein
LPRGEKVASRYQQALGESRWALEYIREQLQQDVNEADLARDLFQRYIK